MPELPEVEVVKQQLQPCVNKHVVDSSRSGKSLRDPIPQVSRILGQRLSSIGRRGKYLVFVLEEDCIISHMGMSGSWRIDTNRLSCECHKNDHFAMHLHDGWCLIYNDPRRFGNIWLVENTPEGLGSVLSALGPEPLTQGWEALVLLSSLPPRKRVKDALLDQHIVAGIGNIYASEILFRSGVDPFRTGKSISLQEAEKMVTETRNVLQEAILNGGSTIHSFKNAEGSSGRMQNLLAVYKRTGKPCVQCGTHICERSQSGRMTFWCPTCQK